jgi:hypothetical protein
LAARLPNISTKAFIFSTKAMFPMALAIRSSKKCCKQKVFRLPENSRVKD